MSTRHHRLLMLRSMVRAMNEEIDRLIAEGIEAEDTPANDTGPGVQKTWEQTRADMRARLRKKGLIK